MTDSMLENPGVIPDSSIDGLVLDRALPVIDTVIRRRCREWNGSFDAREDLRAEVVVRLLRRLRESSDHSPESTIGNFEGYVAGITSRVIDDAIRTSHPEWARLKNRVRYLVTHDQRFRLSLGADGQTVCALQGATPASGARIRTAAGESLAKSVIDILRAGGEELPLDDIVNALAERAGLREASTVLAERAVPHGGADPEVVVESADTLRHLWKEIALLPPRQRAALLLSARDPAGESVLRLLTAAGVVATEAMAGVLDLSQTELAPLLHELPLNDAAIARRLAVTVQQVINLRKAARDRLARRMARPR